LACAADALFTSQDRGRFQAADSGGETPGPIPNPAVKPASADGTGAFGPRESRSPPGFYFCLRGRPADKLVT